MRRLRDFALTESNLRLVGLLAGVVLLVAGVTTAVRTEASTSLLVIGAILFGAVLLSGDWREVILKHGESEARIRREERAKGRAELVEPTRAALEELAEAPSEVQPRLRELSNRLNDWGGFPLYDATSGSANTPGGGFLGLGQYATASSEVRLDKVYLRLHPLGFTPSLFVCDVTNEYGATWTSGDRAWLLHSATPSTAQLIFPDDFPGALLQPGEFVVRWTADYPAITALTYDASDSSTSTTTHHRAEVIATDSFTIAERTTPAAGV
jgi:hypothetical protein